MAIEQTDASLRPAALFRALVVALTRPKEGKPVRAEDLPIEVRRDLGLADGRTYPQADTGHRGPSAAWDEIRDLPGGL